VEALLWLVAVQSFYSIESSIANVAVYLLFEMWVQILCETPQELEECVKALLRLDRAWMPDRPGHSMYIRPFMFSTDGALGVSPSRATTLSVILSPVGPYFKSGGADWAFS
jgi:hypothetical protein